MPERILRDYGIGHPAPHRSRVPGWLIGVALFAAPGAWALQLMINYGLSAEACFPREHLRTLPPDWHSLTSVLLTINLLGLAISAVAIAFSLRAWRITNREASGDHTHLIHAGEGRTRFLAVWGIWGGLWFVIMIAFNTVSLLGVPACAS